MDHLTNLKTYHWKKFLVIELIGRIEDVFHIDEFKDLLLKLVDQGNSFIAIDLSRMEFLSSKSMNIFISLYKRLKKSDGRLVFINPDSSAQELLRVVSLDKLVGIYPSVQHFKEDTRSIK
jgi:anti-anti-sigma factor